jgi:hypothetical protein
MDCGSPMHGSTNRYPRKNDPDGSRRAYQRYICGRYNALGTGHCHANTLVEWQLADAVVGRLLADFLDAGNLDKLRSELRRQLEDRDGKPGPAADAKRLRKQLAELDAKISQGAERLLTMPPDLTAVVMAKLREWQEERNRVAALLDAQDVRQAVPAAKVEQNVEQTIAKLWTLRERLSEADPAKLKAVIREAVARVECWFEQLPYGTKGRMRSRLSRGVIRLRPDLLVHRDVPRARPLITLQPARASPPASRSATRLPYEVQWRDPTIATARSSRGSRVPRR